jgi:cytochrome c553
LKNLSVLLASLLISAAGPALAADAAKTDNDTVRRAIQVCAACHGPNGNSAVAVYPRLAGQQALYTAAQLKAFRDQKRFETDTQAYMWGISALLDDDTIQGLADYYAAQAPAPGKAGNPSLIRKGQEIYAKGVPASGVRACASCHGDNAEGAAGFPRLAGQHAAYVSAQLQVYQTKLRPHGIVMTESTKGLTKAERLAVAEYVQSR